MRLLFGIILGFGLTIGSAYFHDSKLDGPFQAQQRLVNWDVAGELARNTYVNIRDQIAEWTE
jgi:hypothetical protein